MAELIVTTPSQPYFGEILGRQQVSRTDVDILAPPGLSQDFKPYEGSSFPENVADRLVGPVLLPGGVDERLDCFWTCLTGMPSKMFGITGAGAVATGYIPKSWVGLPRGIGSASRFTTPGSIIAYRYPSLGAIKVPSFLPNLAPSRMPFGTKMVRTTSLLRFIGRWVPGIGWALLASDLIIIDQCVANCFNNRSMLRAFCEELTPFCVKPAY